MAAEWNPRRSGVDQDAFAAGRIGPYRVGRPVRTTAVGEVVLALHDSDPRVVELELVDPDLVQHREQHVLSCVNQVLGLQHRHISQVLGAGIHEGLIYVCRAHRLGRSLAEVMDGPIGLPELGPGIAFGVAEALAFLAEEGHRPGVCSLGGFDARDVWLGFDGSISVTGTGFQTLREVECPLTADLDALFVLMDDLGGWLGRAFAPTRPLGLEEVARALRRSHREACGRRTSFVGAHVRAIFPEAVLRERSFFGLTTLH